MIHNKGTILFHLVDRTFLKGLSRNLVDVKVHAETFDFDLPLYQELYNCCS
jgi:hypothetical protein